MKNTIEILKERMQNKSGIHVTLDCGGKTVEGWLTSSEIYKTRFVVTMVMWGEQGGSVAFNNKGKMIDNRIYKNDDIFTIQMDELEEKVNTSESESPDKTRKPVKAKTLAECKEDYVIVQDNMGRRKKVKRGKEFIQYMIKNG